MTPSSLNIAAAPEAAALFPFSAAVPPAAENAAAGSPAFGDLLAANFAQSEQPQQTAGAESAGPAFSTLTLADIWFAGLNVDLNSLNASLDAEESGTPAAATAAADVPVKDAAASDAVDDANAALMALAGCVPGAVPVPELIAAPVDEPSAVDASSQLVELATAPQLGSAAAAPVEAAQSDVVEGSVQETPAPREIKEVAPLAAATAPMAKVAATSVVEGAGNTVSAIDQAGSALATATSEAGQALPVAPGEPKGLAPQAPVVDAAPTAQQASAVEEKPKAQLGKVFDAAPAVQQTGRTRETLAAKLAEMTGGGPSAEVATKFAPGTNLDGDSQSQSQNGSAQDAFVVGVSANATAAHSADSAAVMPVFTVAPPDGGARAVPVAGAVLPPAPPAETVPHPENVGRLIESMKVQVKQGVQEATIRLNPEHLGEVTISVRVERGAVSAVVHSDSAGVKQWLESQEDKLRSGLSEQGLHLEKFTVQRDGSRREPEQQRQQQPAPRYKQQQRDDSAIRFEVLV